MRTSAQLLNLQMLRAIAALMVVIGHGGDELAIITGTSPHSGGFSAFGWGWGVDIFFVISGFIMARTSAGRFGQAGAAREFFVRRLIRIVPLYWLTTTALLLGAFVSARFLNVPIGDGWHVLASYLFIPDLRPSGEVRPVLALGWTLNYEMFFYVFFALAMLAPLQRGVLALCGGFAALIVAGMFGPFGQTQIDYWTSPLLGEFLLGVGLGLAAREGFTMRAVPAAALAMAAFAAYFALGPAFGMDQRVPQFFGAGLPAAALVGAGVFGRELRTRPLTRALGVLGDASYALYLVHPFAIRPLRHLWIAQLRDAPATLYFVTAITCAVLAALALHFCCELPMTRALNRWRDRSRRRETQLAANPAE